AGGSSATRAGPPWFWLCCPRTWKAPCASGRTGSSSVPWPQLYSMRPPLADRVSNTCGPPQVPVRTSPDGFGSAAGVAGARGADFGCAWGDATASALAAGVACGNAVDVSTRAAGSGVRGAAQAAMPLPINRSMQARDARMGSDLVAGVDRHDTAAEVMETATFETGVFHHGLQDFLRGMPTDRLGQVAIAVGVTAGEQLAQVGQDVERMEVVQRLEPVRLDLRELQHPRLSTDLEHAQHLAQGRVLVGDVAQAEGDGHQVETVVGERQCLGVALD